MRRMLLSVAVMQLTLLCALAQDPVKVDPQEYKVELENNYVRVLRVTRKAYSKVPMHEHPAYVLIPLNDAHQKVTTSDGKVLDVSLKAGVPVYGNPVKHEELNVGDTDGKVILIELKTPPGTIKQTPVPPDMDPVKIDPAHHIVLLENEHVRAIRTILEPHIKSPMHAHPSYVVVYMTELHTSMTMPDGKVIDNPRHAGEVAWRDPLKHVTENQQDIEAVEIQVEMK